MINIYSMPTLITSLLILWLGFSVFNNKKNNINNKAFFLVCFAATIWLFFASLGYNSNNEKDAFYFMQVSYIGVIFLPICIFYFIISFLNIRRLKRLNVYLFFIGIFFTILLLFTGLLIRGVRRYFWGYYPIAGKYHFLFLIFFVSLVISCSIFLIHNIFIKTGLLIRRKQVQYVVIAFLFFSFGTFDFIPNYNMQIYPFGYIPTLLFLTIITYSIVRFRLLDISIAITRSSIFIAVYSLILGTPLLLIYYAQNELVNLLGISWWIVPFLCSTVLATLGPFLYIYFDKKAEERLLKEQRNYQNILRSASAGMIRIRNLDLLLKLIVYVVAKIVKIKHVVVYLLDNENQRFSLRASRISQQEKIEFFNFALDSPLVQQLIADRGAIVTEEISMKSKDEPSNRSLVELTKQLFGLNASLVVPSFVENRLIGILILGEKRSGKLYSQDDLAVFSVLANQAALAIENAQFYDEIKRTHEQLFQAEKLATIGTMADGLSHQINNRFHALSLIAGDSIDFIKTFDDSQCSEAAKKAFTDLRNSLEKIQVNVIQGGEVVKGLLKYSRPGDSGFELVGLNEIINGAIDMVQYKIKLKEIDLVQNIPSDLPKLYGNVTQLQEVFFNLIDNAYDAIKEKQNTLEEEDYKGKIEISASEVNGSIELNVSDNGTGIKDTDRKKLFTPFFTTKATARKGTGLGLYVIEKIIASHNGRLQIDSTYPKGTSFIITLPIKSA